MCKSVQTTINQAQFIGGIAQLFVILLWQRRVWAHLRGKGEISLKCLLACPLSSPLLTAWLSPWWKNKDVASDVPSRFFYSGRKQSLLISETQPGYLKNVVLEKISDCLFAVILTFEIQRDNLKGTWWHSPFVQRVKVRLSTVRKCATSLCFTILGTTFPL